MKIKGIVELQSTKVVDLVAFKAERARARLPLFDADGTTRTVLSTPGAADTNLSARNVEHRSRMLKHLSGPS